jgi:RNA polymerase sigma-70 factor, ECF subfamily
VKSKEHILPADDRALIKEAQGGDDRAFTKLVKRYEKLVYSFAFKICRDKEKAEETWQDTFVNVYRKLHQFDGKSKFTTWLYSIVANNCRMKHRRTKLEMASIQIEEHPGLHDRADTDDFRSAPGNIPAWRDTPLDMIIEKELKSKLDNAIRKLPYNYRVVFILHDVEGQSAEGTGNILKLSVPAVKSRLRRARIFLREQLNDYMTA